MSQGNTQQSPRSPRRRTRGGASTHDKEGWLALMADDVVIEDPIGPSVTNPDGNGVRGKEGRRVLRHQTIGANQVTVTCEETFPSSSPKRSRTFWR